jgi:hypothetical protein
MRSGDGGNSAFGAGGIRGVLSRVVKAKTEPATDVAPKIPKDALDKIRRAVGYSGIYIIGPKDKWPTTIGTAAESKNGYYTNQRGYWEEHFVHHFMYTVGPPVAARVKARLVENLKPKQQFFNENWYNISADEAYEELVWAAECENIELFDEVEALKRYYALFQREVERRAGIERIGGPPLAAVSAPTMGNVVPLRPRK